MDYPQGNGLYVEPIRISHRFEPSLSLLKKIIQYSHSDYSRSLAHLKNRNSFFIL